VDGRYCCEPEVFRLDIELIREFIVLTQTLNYTKAAQKLHLTQPTLSKHVVSIEKELGCSLLARDRRSVELTDAGTMFAAAAMQIVDTYDEVQLKLGELQRLDPIRVNGQLFDESIGAIASIAATLMDAEGKPPIVYENPSEGDFLDRLLSGQIDIALTYVDPERLEELGLEYMPLARSQFAALVNPDNPIARMKSVSIDDMRNLRFVRFVDKYASNGWANIESVCREHGFTPRTRTVLGHNSMSYASVSLGADDVCILESTRPQLRYLSALSRVSVVPVVDDDAMFHVYAIYQKSNYERVKFALDAYAQARRVVMNHGNDDLLVDAL